jgi:uncharacterized protein with PQ loop repeat
MSDVSQFFQGVFAGLYIAYVFLPQVTKTNKKENDDDL